MGIADLTTDRLLAAIDPTPFRMNNLTACFLWRSKLPFDFPTDRACIETGVETCWQPIGEKSCMAVIPNTLEMADLWVSRGHCSPRPKRNLHLEVTGLRAAALPFDAAGNIVQERMFPHSVRGRRQR